MEGDDLSEVFGVSIYPDTDYGTADTMEYPIGSNKYIDYPLEVST